MASTLAIRSRAMGSSSVSPALSPVALKFAVSKHVGGAACALTITSCGLFVSFDDYDASGQRPPPTSPTFALRGSATGLDGRTVSLSAHGHSIDAGDGPFEFPIRLSDGSPYSVAIARQPQGRTCAVEPATGTIAGRDIDDLRVGCLASDATL